MTNSMETRLTIMDAYFFGCGKVNDNSVAVQFGQHERHSKVN